MSLARRFSTAAIVKGYRFLAVAVFVLLLAKAGQAQQRDRGTGAAADTAATAGPVAATDTLAAITDSLSLADSLAVPGGDSAKVLSKEEELGIRISKDALPAVVRTQAKDSAVLDMKHSEFYLYGNAQANYEEIQIKSGKLIFHQKTNVLSAEPILDTAGKKISLQEFKQGEETFTYDTLKYNFKSKRAIVRNAHTKYGDGFVISEQVKRNPDESIYGFRSLYTTCNLDHPHFGIRARKIKVIPGRVIASGPANLELMDIPTPLFLPFGMFPIKQGQRSGFILPTYSLEEARGLGLTQGGYYFAVNDNLGVITRFDVYSKGSWSAFSTAQYAKRYQYNGNLSLSYGFLKTGEGYEPGSFTQKDFKVTWMHQVDPKARPGTNFSASVNFGTVSFNTFNNINLGSRLSNDYNSSISYNKTWIGKPYSLTVGLTHSQSTLTRALTIGLPEINFNLGQFSPFQRKVMSGTPRWYEKITVSYSVSAINRLNTYDSLFHLNSLNFRDFDNGIKHSATIQGNYNVLRYFNWNISVPYFEYWNTKQVYRIPDRAAETVDTTIRTGFFATRDFSVTTSLSTRIYGLKTFRKGKIAGIRHVLTPSLDLNYTPNFAERPFEYLYGYSDALGGTSYRTPYERSPIQGPLNAVSTGSVGFSIGNTLQMKVRNTDSSGKAGTRIIRLIDAFNMSGRYNLFADSFNMSSISMNFRTSILEIFNIQALASFDPYRRRNGYRVNEYRIANGEGLAQFTGGQLGLSMSFRGEKKNEKEQEDAMNKNGEVKRLLQNGGYNDYYDFNIPWNLSVTAGINATRRYILGNEKDTMIYSPNLTFNGGFNLTERWKVNVTSGFEFTGIKKMRLSTTQIDISRDLHCWQMNLSLIPFGYLRSFFFTLQVKSSVLQDLKLTRRRTFQDANY